ncbi:Similar to hypothetical protein NECHADRAFT_14093 [Nectria haematococca mpVI 77-13-4]; acc. no. XP_003039333 [Pyronema omphalodes CBS 100304]|uniref:MFS-type drug efflux transporter P55 n=1 Tax=Pyronema omphalodes (strain CBS 100304) TaxID=1076935 RepID=U4L4K7_PYROM|nr:Similar to hypothetical protein NECHADRAFT_14093 [Nectria haematococca mpVI 77-13-4]; acc. no. XP_003039333 [Pyronema omphalodes CBS 100304]
MPIAGGLSDIFGRRHFFIYGALISMTGTIISVCSKSVDGVIVGMTLKGIGGAAGNLAMAAVAEIVPKNQRGRAQAVLELGIMPWVVFDALTGGAMVKYQPGRMLGFRINCWYGTFAAAVFCTMELGAIFNDDPVWIGLMAAPAGGAAAGMLLPPT